jgi:hypothetical protein
MSEASNEKTNPENMNVRTLPGGTEAVQLLNGTATGCPDCTGFEDDVICPDCGRPKD